MANYNKSFNFKNGIQVDNDNFVVNANGLVGIGTTIPKNYILNVQGDVSISGLITASNLNIGVVTATNLNTQNVSVSSSITAATFYGSAAGLTGIYAVAVDGWYISGGNISTTSKVGIGTTLPIGNFQVGTGVTINSSGDATYLGIITATSFNGKFIGDGSLLTNTGAAGTWATTPVGIHTLKNVGIGTTNPTSKLTISGDALVTGVITATTFNGQINTGIGTVTTLNSTNVTASNINVSGIITASTRLHTELIGIATANPISKFQIERYGLSTGIGNFSATAGSATDIDTFTISSSDFKAIEYTLHFNNGNNIQAQKVLVMQNGTTAYSQEYAIMSEPNLIVSIGVTISSGTCKLQATPETGISGLTTYRFVRGTLL